MLQAIIKGIRTGARHWKTALVVYVIQLILALTLGFQVYHVFEASIGNSLELDKLLDGYDHTVLSDFLNVHGASVSPLVGQLRWLLVLYGIFSVFLQAGMLSGVVKNETGWRVIWHGGAAYFFPFLKIAVAILTVTVLWSGVLWLPFLAFFTTSPEVLSSEKVSVQLLFLVAGVWLLGLVFLFNWSVGARLFFLEEGGSIYRCIPAGLRWAGRRFLKTTGLAALFALLFGIPIAVYWMAETRWGMTSPWLVFVFLLIQQALVYVKIVGRIMVYGGLKALHSEPE
jgi:hypothetical protein